MTHKVTCLECGKPAQVIGDAKSWACPACDLIQPTKPAPEPRIVADCYGDGYEYKHGPHASDKPYPLPLEADEVEAHRANGHSIKPRIVAECWHSACGLMIRSWDGEEITHDPKPLTRIQAAECRAAGHDVRPIEVRR